MRKPTVDFLRHDGATPLLGWALLAVGSLSFATAVWVSHRWHAEQLALDRLVAQRDAERRASKGPVPVAPPSPEQRRVQQAAIEAARPWLPVLGAIEAATTDPVYLVSMNLEPSSGTVAVAGEASSFDEVLRYAKRLSESQALSNAVLASHEQTSDPKTGRLFVRFKLTSQWKPR